MSAPDREKRSRAAVAAALEAIEAVAAGRPLRLALAAALAARPRLGPKERRHAAVAARGVARWLRVVDAALVHARAPKAIPADVALLRYAAWRVSILGDAPRETAAALRLPGPRRPRALSDETLLAVALALPPPGPRGPLTVRADGTPIAPPRSATTALALRHSVPDLFAEKLLESLGEAEADACLTALDAEPRLSLRVNGARASRADVLAALAREGIAAEPGASPLAVTVGDRAGLFDSAPFREGLVEVQDEGSQAIVALCRAAPGQRWLDLCAGSGGKSLALAAGGAEVVAWDASASRLAELPRRARRARARVEVAREEPTGTFDGVLVDAPCSGSGAIHREPDARWRIDAPAVVRFSAVQREVLARAAGRVRAGGALVYATCSLFREEGEEVVAAFLREHPAFRLVEEARRWPHRDAGGGFYLARLEMGLPGSRPGARAGGGAGASDAP